MKLLLGVTGSIACYKSYDLCRELTKNGHEVIIILSNGATKFIRSETFKYLGAKEVYSADDDFNTDKYQDFSVLHIELSKWADRLIVAPASANKISQFSHGYADDLLTSLFLAFTKSILIFPAMNTNMLNNKIINDNIKRLGELENVYIHGTKEGLLACGDIGEGKLEDIDIIYELSLNYPIQVSKNLSDRKVLITTGSTIAHIDPVRFITNPSSGLTGYELAKAYLSKGFEVIVIAGHNPTEKVNMLRRFPRITFLQADTTEKMFRLVKDNLEKVDTYISAAAISDIQFEVKEEKIKKDSQITLPTIKNAPDILKYVVENKKHQKVIGFAAETSNLLENMQRKISSKPVDYLVGNLVSNGLKGEMIGFKSDTNEYSIINGEKLLFQAKMTKRELALAILDLVEND